MEYSTPPYYQPNNLLYQLEKAMMLHYILSAHLPQFNPIIVIWPSLHDGSMFTKAEHEVAQNETHQSYGAG